MNVEVYGHIHISDFKFINICRLDSLGAEHRNLQVQNYMYKYEQYQSHCHKQVDLIIHC